MAAASSAFALVTHGGGTHTCAAAVLGLLLRGLSPSTPAIAVVFNATAAMRNILSAVGLHVHDAGRFRSERYRVPGRPGWAPRILPTGQKDALWALPYERVLYWDSDHIPLPSARARRRVHALWRLLDDEHALAAAPNAAQHVATKCFNSGLMLLRPSEAARRALARAHDRRVIAWNLKCRHGWFAADQPFLNFVFQNWTTLGEDAWRVRTSADLPPDACAAATADALAAEADSFHFFHSHAPWRPGCRECTRAGRACAGTSPRPRGADRCAAAAAAAAAWWDAFGRLPAEARGWCEATMAEAAGVGGGASACVS